MNNSKVEAEEIKNHRINEIFGVLEMAATANYIGESVSQLDHALQCAFWAQQAKADPELVLAALFHDIGHLCEQGAPQMAGLGVVDHEEIGATFLLKNGLSKRIANLVRSHVRAKRYLCYRKPDYYERLSSASKGTLEWQGGKMSQEEAREFEIHPDF